MNKNFVMKLLVILIFFVSAICHAQNNLVLNYSFENTISCPQSISQFYLATNWDDTNSGPDSCTTPDLYATCAITGGGANSPNSLLGYQPSRTGTHHAGIILFENAGTGWREFLQGTLVTPLDSGQEYCVKFYVSHGDVSRFATADIGVYFSDTLLQKNHCITSGPASPVFNVIPQLKYTGVPIMDSVNWVPLEWTYMASGGEKYITIGNFESDSSTFIVSVDTLSFLYLPFSYYFIDDVEVTTDVCCPEITLVSSSKVSCNGNDGSATISVSGGISPYTFSWSAGSSITSTSIDLPEGMVTVTVTDWRGCAVTKEIAILQVDSPQTIVPTITQNDSSLTSSLATTYQWLIGGDTISGATLQSYVVTQSGTYQVITADSNGCIGISDTVVLLFSPLPPGNLNANPILKMPLDSKIQLTWTDNSTNEDGFIIFRTLDTSLLWVALDSIAINSTDYLNEELTGNTEYFYKVAAYNSYGISDFSNIASAITLSTGITAIKNYRVEILPNPNNGHFSMQFDFSEITEKIEIINMIGETIFSEIYRNQQMIDIDLTSRPTGVYFIKVTAGEDVSFKKVITF